MPRKPRPNSKAASPRKLDGGAAKSMRGFMKRFQVESRLPRITAGWMKLLREGERV